LLFSCNTGFPLSSFFVIRAHVDVEYRITEKARTTRRWGQPSGYAGGVASRPSQLGSQNGNIRELWLFGSRAKGTSRPESDVDIAIALMPTDSAFGNYVALWGKWKQQIEAIVGCRSSFGAIGHDTPLDLEVRGTGVLLWARD
jgi:predicted nucleotidyltransferase